MRQTGPSLKVVQSCSNCSSSSCSGHVSASPVFSSGLGGIMCSVGTVGIPLKPQDGKLVCYRPFHFYKVLNPLYNSRQELFSFMNRFTRTLNNNTMNTMNSCNDRSFTLTLDEPVINNSSSWSVLETLQGDG